LKPVVITSDIATGVGVGWGEGEYDVIFSYIYMNTTKLVLPYPYLVRLDCFLSQARNQEGPGGKAPLAAILLPLKFSELLFLPPPPNVRLRPTLKYFSHHCIFSSCGAVSNAFNC